MASLSKERRRQLERTVAEARMIAEQGAEQSLRRLAVDVPRPHDALTTEEKKFRVSLRVHAKQLGDQLDERPTRLIQAVAYEHWHRLLFARFLIENELLLHPEHGVALSLDEVKEIALGENREWVEVAADYAQRMLLRRVFQPEDPALRVSLAPEKRLQLEAKLNSLPLEVFLADDSLGWVYQFWQKEAKEAVNKSEVKIGADELAPVTQLFTDDYMVLFLLENTLGAWWTARRGKPDLQGYTWTYLRLNEDGTPAAGTFEGWPITAREVRVLDPCMGSGHFLTFALPILARMRVAEEGLSLSDAISAVLRENLFGLELDARCSQIGAFNLALTAWKLAGKHFEIPQLNLACSGLGINAKEDDWVKLAGKEVRLRETMEKLYGLFRQAPVLGSLINPVSAGGTLFAAHFKEVRPLLERALASEQRDDATDELAVAAQGVIKAAHILSEHFTLIATNVPYLGRGKQDDNLKEYCDQHHPVAKSDLATCFLERCLAFCDHGGTTAIVTQQTVLFLTTYEPLRRQLLSATAWNLIARLGEHGFDSTQAAGAFVALLVISRQKPSLDHQFVAIDASEEGTPSEKEAILRTGGAILLNQAYQLRTPSAKIVLAEPAEHRLLTERATSFQGIKTGDDQRVRRFFWELPTVTERWRFFQSTVLDTKLFGGLEAIIDWRDGGEGLARRQGLGAWAKRGVMVSQMRELPVAFYLGDIFDSNASPIIPKRPEDLPAIWALCSSSEYAPLVRRIDRSLKPTNASLVEVPFDSDRWNRIAIEKFPHGLPNPASSDPTQWLFEGHPSKSEQPLQVAVARLVGYRWPRQTGSSFADCPALNPDGLEKHAEVDGIVCLTSLAGKASGADRLRALLSDSYGEQWSATKLSELLGTSASLEVWLRDRFFEEHCEIFHQRPFIWHVWDGRNDGFHALVNCHKLDHKTLEKFIYSYLGDWISRQRQDLGSGVEGADGRLAAAEHLQGELKKILDGEKPHDVFVRWKSVKEQPLGWNPDLNDGVCVNIRPWIMEARLYRATKAGILRVTPNMKYGKDRGKEPAHDPKEFPWFKDSTERNNDVHLTLEEKRRARGLV